MKKGDYQTTKQAEKYHKKRFVGGLSLISEDELNTVKTWLVKIPKSAIYLDMGTGTGRVVNLLVKQKPRKIYAVDTSSAMLEYLRKLFPKQTKNKTIQTINSKSDNIPLPNHSVDIVTSLHLFKHLSNSSSTIREVARLLKPGGYFIFDILNQKSIIGINLKTCYALSKPKINELLEKQGFSIKQTVFLHHLGETVYNLPVVNLIHTLDQMLSESKLETGTKIFILAQKA